MTKDFGDKNDEKSDSYSHINQGFSSFLAQKPKSDCLNYSLSVLNENWYNISYTIFAIRGLLISK
jgi:hypothetical protein